MCDQMIIYPSVPGFRFIQCFLRDWAGETTAFPRKVIEHALAHKLWDKPEAAYQRGDLLAKRRELMQAWASFCVRPAVHKAAGVTPIRGKAA
jgi:hypothetical protein